MSSNMPQEEDHLERLVRKLKYYGGSAEKMFESAVQSGNNHKMGPVKERIALLEELVLEIPDSATTLFDEWMEKVVHLWEQYSAALSEHRAQNGASAYPQPNTTCQTNLVSSQSIEDVMTSPAIINSHQGTTNKTTNLTHTSASTVVVTGGNPEKRSALQPRTGVSNQQKQQSSCCATQTPKYKNRPSAKSTKKTVKTNGVTCGGDDNHRSRK